MGASFVAGQVALMRPIPDNAVHLTPAHVKEKARLLQIVWDDSSIGEIQRYMVLTRLVAVEFLPFDICPRFWILQSRPRQVRDDNGLIVAGGFQYQESADFALYKFDKNGNKLWGKLYGEPNAFLMNKSVIPTRDGGYFINCQKSKAYNISTETDQIYVIKTDPDGDF